MGARPGDVSAATMDSRLADTCAAERVLTPTDPIRRRRGLSVVAFVPTSHGRIPQTGRPPSVKLDPQRAASLGRGPTSGDWLTRVRDLLHSSSDEDHALKQVHGGTPLQTKGLRATAVKDVASGTEIA